MNYHLQNTQIRLVDDDLDKQVGSVDYFSSLPGGEALGGTQVIASTNGSGEYRLYRWGTRTDVSGMDWRELGWFSITTETPGDRIITLRVNTDEEGYGKVGFRRVYNQGGDQFDLSVRIDGEHMVNELGLGTGSEYDLSRTVYAEQMEIEVRSPSGDNRDALVEMNLDLRERANF